MNIVQIFQCRKFLLGSILNASCAPAAGRGEHACETLRQYRTARPQLGEGRQPAKLLVCAFSSTGFSIADPSDPGMLDVAGLDASLPEIMRSFLLGEI